MLRPSSDLAVQRNNDERVALIYEIDFLPVGEGSGDAIVIRYGDDDSGYRLHVVDGGRTDTANTIIDHIQRYYTNAVVDHMVLSHADDDHATGLVGVMKHFRVKNLWMNRPWLYAAEILHHFHGNFTLDGLVEDIKKRHPYLVELEELAKMKGTVIHDAFQGAKIGVFTVLAPTRDRYVNSIPDFGKTPTRYRAEDAGILRGGILSALVEKVKKRLETWDIETLANNSVTSASNESCLVQHAVMGDEGVLLTADVGPIGLTEAAQFAHQLSLRIPRFVQVPHHGSRHNVTPDVLDTWLGSRVAKGEHRGTAFCSVGANKPEYPRGQVKNAFIRRGFKVYSTRSAWLSHYRGSAGHGGIPAVPEEFEAEVEEL